MKMKPAAYAIFGGIVLAFPALLSSAAATKTDFDPQQSAPAGAQNPAVRAAVEAARPGGFHKRLEVLLGQWNTAWKVWHGPDQAPSDQATGSARFRSILGGRFIEGTYTGKGILGTTFEGRLFLGFDARRREYSATWFNSFETASNSYSGPLAVGEVAATPLRTLTLIGRPGPHPKVSDGSSRVTFTVDPKRVVEEQYATDLKGREFKAVEVVYTRAGAQ